MELLDPNREWMLADWMFLGLFLIAFSGAVSKAIIIAWDKIHPKSIKRLSNWLNKKGIDS